MTDDVLTIALDLAARGMHLFPVDHPEFERCAGIGANHYPATCTERGKHPCVPFTKQATTDPRQLAAWLTGYPRNLGVACGPSGLLVIDEDTPGDLGRYAETVGATIPETFTVTTGRGSHYYFRAPADLDLGNAERKLKPYGVNVRGRGGYVVGPGSLHATGAIYTTERDVPPAEMPSWLLDALAPPVQSVEPVDWSTWDDKPRGLAAVPETIAGPRDGRAGGERHEALVRYACSLRGRDVPLPEAEPLFRLVWERCEQPPACATPLPWAEARGKLLDVYARYPVTTPRPEIDLDQDAPPGPVVGASWQPVDLVEIVAGLLAGTITRHLPTVGRREDGACLFYRGKVNGIAGASGAGKTWTALHAAAQELAAGEAVIYVDLEDDEVGVVGRLLDIGVDPATILERLRYISPGESYGSAARAALEALVVALAPSLVVIDSTGESMALDGAKPNDDDDTARWFRRLPTALARLGPAVVVLDHVVKADDGGLWPIGSQRKRAAINGAQYMQGTLRAFAKGTPGAAKLVCAKDRHGNYRSGQKIAELTATPTGDGLDLSLSVPGEPVAADGDGWRPTGYTERVSGALAGAGEPLTFNGITERVTGKRAHVRVAVDVLIREGYLATAPGARGATLHTLVKPFSEADDSREPVDLSMSPNRLVTGSGSLDGEPGTSHLTESRNQWGTSGEPVLVPACTTCGEPADDHLPGCPQLETTELTG